jgi:DNA polymerase-3 subunit gamma/tau
MASLISDRETPAAQPGEYVVVARRYRPQDFTQLVGQQQVSQALGNAIATNRVGHAYLFTGARGVGKTSTARIFAKALNCVNGPTTHPCGECDICRGIASGEDVDVIEIDGASNRGIDEIRQLRSNVNVRPSRARFKIYIIDEVHMLTTQAFNALLKTLEEPPEHVKFIFCTTEADKIPITVLSRCQRFDFAPIEQKSILQRLQFIAQNEGVEADPEALQILARRAAGSMRDSQSLLEQLLSFGGKHIRVDDVHAMLGTAKSSRLFDLAHHLVHRDTAAALQEINAAVEEGVDLGQLAEQLVGFFRDVMAAHVGCGADLLLHSAPGELAQLQELGSKLGLETTLAVAQILDQAVTRMRQSTHVRTLLEIALVRICKLEDLDSLPALIHQLQGAGPTASAPVVAVRPAAERPGSQANISPPASRAPRPADEEKKTAETGVSLKNEPAADSEAAPLTAALATGWWQQTLTELSDIVREHAAKYASLAISGPNRLVVRFPPEYDVSRTRCERPENRSKLEQTLAAVSGRALRLDFVTVEGSANGSNIRTNGPRVAPTPAGPNRRARIRELERHPLVRQAIEMFDAEVIQVLDAPKEESSEETPSPVDGPSPADEGAA